MSDVHAQMATSRGSSTVQKAAVQRKRTMRPVEVPLVPLLERGMKGQHGAVQTQMETPQGLSQGQKVSVQQQKEPQQEQGPWAALAHERQDSRGRQQGAAPAQEATLQEPRAERRAAA